MSKISRAKNVSLAFLGIQLSLIILLNYYEQTLLQLIEHKVNESIKRKNSKTNHSTLLDIESTLLNLIRVNNELFV